MACSRHFARGGVVLLSALILSACGEQNNTEQQQEVVQPARPAVIEDVQRSTMSSLSFHGVVRSSERADLSFRQSGKLVELLVEEGDRVEAGQVLAKLDQRQLQIALNSANTELRKAQADYKRGLQIFESSQAISRSDLEKLQTQRDLSRNRYADAKRNLDDATLVAPFAGVIAQKNVNNFAQVQANQVVYSLQDLSQLEVVIEVPSQEFLANDEHRNQEAYGYVDGFADTPLDLQYKYFVSEANPLTQTYSVILGFTDMKGLNVLPGMTVRVEGKSEANAETGVIMVPLAAVQPNNMGEQFVWAVDAEGNVQQRVVTVGELVGKSVIINAGLEVGDRIVTVAANSIQPGMQVYPLQTAAGE
uniref:efflux RND transporter periplasmic adaptor subunit n=1 Tax=Thaumasiovibrio occultus TaxID=1891184 RepID=UPI00131A6414|nr:efflux RND transporter periplasmic adaptor subunit [Thaumasiovibrio occultus]